ncbi:MAG: F0F1 ATP synthase subunit A [Spirochaetales bacterium]|nr:F0F1 ATP synthase subunit A [Spirochaetales bacterium]
MNVEVNLTPDSMVFWQWGFVKLNATIVFTWAVMLILVIGSFLITRNLSTGQKISRWQNMLETIVSAIRKQIADMTQQKADPYIAFLGTLFLFISVSNLLAVVPYFESPAGSLTTAAALAVCVFFAVPIFGILKQGLPGYLKQYIEPSPMMLPFNIIGEFSRTLALAVRLFGNVMSGSLIIGVLLALAPLFVPVILQVLELLIGQIQAYIFAALATIYIASATRARQQREEKIKQRGEA